MAVLVLGGIVACLGWFARTEHAPSVHGKPLGDWFAQMGQARTTAQTVQIREAIQSLGPAAVPFLVDRLQVHDSPWARRYRSFYTSRVSRWPNWLISRLPQPSPENADGIQLDAVTALDWLGDAALPAAPDLADALFDDFPPVRFAAGQLLRRLGPRAREALPVVIRALQSTNQMVANNAIGVVYSLGRDDTEAPVQLVRLLSDPDEVKVRALQTLSRFGRTAQNAQAAIADLLSSTNSDVKTAATIALWDVAPGRQAELLPAMEQIAGSADKGVQQLVGLKLAQMQPLAPSAGELLAVLVRDGDDGFSWSVFTGLANRGQAASNAVPALVAGLAAGNPRVAAKAAQALGVVGRPDRWIVEALHQAQRHENLMVRDAAEEALRSLHSPGAPQ